MSIKDDLVRVGIWPSAADELIEAIQGAESINTGTAGSGVTAAEYGDGHFHKTVLSMSAKAVTLTDDAAVAQWATLPLYTFPVGNIIVLGAAADVDLTLNETWWVDASTGTVGVGTVAQADGSVIATTRQNIVPVTNIAAMVAQVGPINAQSTGVLVTATAGASAALARLNMTIADNVAHMPDSVTNGAFTGNATGWTLGAGWAYGNNKVDATTASTSMTQAADALAVALVPGVSYSVAFTATRSAGSVVVSVGGTAGTPRSTSATFTQTIVAGTDGTLKFTGTGFTGTIDDVSCVPLTGSGLITGAITLAWVNLGNF